MQRSRVNEIINEADAFIRAHGFHLPSFAYLTPEDWAKSRDDYSAIVDARLGWDITDYGEGRFEEKGLFLFTTRNGSQEELKSGGGMCYAEKIMISRKDQLSPLHRHIVKTEDIINRGGAKLAIKMYESGSDGKLDEHLPVPVLRDGRAFTYRGGETILIEPGDSITLRPGNWHAFWGEGGDVLIGEVSTVNDDLTDNIFAEPIGRFSQIEEDTTPIHLLVSDYDAWLS